MLPEQYRELVTAYVDGELDLVCLFGRGDKDLAEVLGNGRP